LQRDELSVLFASQRREETPAPTVAVAHTSFRHLTVDEMGDFDDWPEDFFDSLDTDTTALARAVAARVRARNDPGGR
jgi:hypothetical protein